ncbi:MAG: hypothetical protein J6M02_02430 [Clostridia bacterium]|nr:hypothetical protein [Clostridia bacterium]
MEKPIFNDSFSVEDIRKLRDYNYERTKDFTADEIIKDIREKAANGIARLEELRKEKKVV